MTANAAMTQDTSDNFMPSVRGRLRPDVMLARRCWFGVGGPADWLFTPEDENDLAQFLRNLPAHIPVTILGVGSNLLVRDGGIDGVVIRLGRQFATITAKNEHIVAGAGALDINVAHIAADAGLSGIEFLVGIPGTIGGAVKMNAGAYGRELSDCAIEITAIDRQGTRHIVPASELNFRYRHTDLPDGWIVTSATLKGTPDNKQAIIERMQEISATREATQPVRSKTGGSTFKNPDGHKAWQLIDEAECRGLRRGDAQISALHCNFLINHGDATANDLELLGEDVREQVKAKTGVTLEWEIKRIGRSETSSA